MNCFQESSCMKMISCCASEEETKSTDTLSDTGMSIDRSINKLDLPGYKTKKLVSSDNISGSDISSESDSGVGSVRTSESANESVPEIKSSGNTPQQPKASSRALAPPIEAKLNYTRSVRRSDSSLSRFSLIFQKDDKGLHEEIVEEFSIAELFRGMSLDKMFNSNSDGREVAVKKSVQKKKSFKVKEDALPAVAESLEKTGKKDDKKNSGCSETTPDVDSTPELNLENREKKKRKKRRMTRKTKNDSDDIESSSTSSSTRASPLNV